MEAVTIDITDDPFYRYAANFNPSIIQLPDGKYLMSFHTFRRVSLEKSRELGADFNHPWMGGPYSRTWWTPYSRGFEGTGFLILNENFTIYKILHQTVEGASDMRLTWWNNKILATYNKTHLSLSKKERSVIGVDRTSEGLPRGDPDCCTFIYYMIINISSVYNLELEEHTRLCENLSAYHEKNWSPWVTPKGKLRISYHIVPRHTVFVPEENMLNCEAYFQKSDSNIFNRITEYYGRRNISFSLSTPAIRWENSTYLAVGHVKLHPFTDLTIKAMEGTRHLPPHPANWMRYYMFFYTFNWKTRKS
jgi:hypothetical protein